jgi:uncharacterized protein YciI
MKDVRHVVVHAPGPAWRAGTPAFEQDGVRAHAAHWSRWLEAGKLAFGGPFLDAQGGGMMIPAEGVEEAEIVAFAHEDPAVVSGLLTVAIRAWLVGMKA